MEGLFADCLVDIEEEGFVKKFKNLKGEMNFDWGLYNLSDDQLVKFIVATYDKNSPYVSRYSDWGQRRRETAKYCNFPRTGDFWIEEAQNIILGKNILANQLILWYVFCHNDLEFMKLHAKQSMYQKQVTASVELEFDKPSDYDKLNNNINSLSSEIKELRDEIFSGEKSEDLLSQLYSFASTITTNFAPEDVAERIENGEEPVDEVPYEGGYKPGPMHFLGDE